jgi:hypothetical protein
MASNPPWYLSNDTAGPGDIYKSDSSPFKMEKGRLVEFRPANAIRMLSMDNLDPAARSWIYHGLAAWVICPNVVIKTKTKVAPPLKSNQFVHTAMLLPAARALAFAFGRSRWFQHRDQKKLEAKSRERPMNVNGNSTNEQGDNAAAAGTSDARHLLRMPFMNMFNYELFFALGGIPALMEAGSPSLFEASKANQEIPVRNVVKLVAKFREFARVQSNSRPQKGLNAACTFLGTANKTRSPTFKLHWKNLKPSAAYLYAASLIDGGDFLNSFFSGEDFEASVDAPASRKRLETWLGYTAAVAENVLAHRHLPSNWRALAPPGVQTMDLPETVNAGLTEVVAREN